MRRIRRTLLLMGLLFGFFVTPLSVAAVDSPLDEICTGEAANSQFCNDAQQEANREIAGGDKSLLYRIMQTIVLLTGVISVIMIIIGGFKYVLSAGDSSGTKGAKDTILYAVIGLVVALFAQVIVSFVLSRFL